MKDDIFILDSDARRYLPRLLPVMLGLGIAGVAAAKIWGDRTYSFLMGRGPMLIFFAEVIYALIVLGDLTTNRSVYGYKLGMLRMSERRLFVLSCIFNIMVFLMLWAVMCCSVIVQGKILDASGVFAPSPQSLYVDYTLSGYIRLFVPMDDVLRTAAVIMLLVSFGLLSACSFANRLKRKPGLPTASIFIYVLLLYFLMVNRTGAYGGSIFLPILAVFALVGSAGLSVLRLSDLSKGTNVEEDDGE